MAKKMNWAKLEDKKTLETRQEENWKDTERPQFQGITPKQRALMVKLGIVFDNRTTKQAATLLISKRLG